MTTKRKRVEAWALLNDDGRLLSLHTERGSHDWKSRYLMKDFKLIYLVPRDREAEAIVKAARKLVAQGEYSGRWPARKTLHAAVERYEAKHKLLSKEKP